MFNTVEIYQLELAGLSLSEAFTCLSRHCVTNFAYQRVRANHVIALNKGVAGQRIYHESIALFYTCISLHCVNSWSTVCQQLVNSM